MHENHEKQRLPANMPSANLGFIITPLLAHTHWSLPPLPPLPPLLSYAFPIFVFQLFYPRRETQ